ncbi:MAG TPA: SpoIIE family protein phosphatase [Thermoanaerobaculia bacterium]|jgi:sigma-B regulation protein RsbU (phosphoserine phosphatase)|nr:SpoIIE family protein phosphatase [Thermoanaerobaculia bacterium]
MNPMDVGPSPKRRRISPAFVVWLAGVAAIIVLEYFDRLLERFDRDLGILGVFSFFAWLLVIGLTLYGFAVITRWVLRKLFWTVGRRLFLSYLLVGVLPFFLMTILLLTVVYMFAAVMTQAAYRGERQATLGQMEAWAQEYSTSGRRIAGALPSLEIYDTAAASGAKLPDWLRTRSFSGVVEREGQPLLVAARQFPLDDDRTRGVVLVQPLDKNWTDALFEKSRMIVRTARAEAKGDEPITLKTDDNEFRSVLAGNIGTNIIWGDLVEVTTWANGSSNDDHRLFTLIINPPRNLMSYYFGESGGRYFEMLLGVIITLTVMLMMMYGIAALFAGVLIFSISRAVNRIEKGTRAVERGDFSYRIKMKRHNQLGAMAQSFDSMTASIASLLSTVSEKERLQSEIAIAASIQRNLLPKEGPKFRGVSFSAHFEPTTSIGGDYYDVFNLDKSRLAVAIGDVSGHGLSTGLVMAMVKAAMTTLVEEGADEVSLFRRLNELVYRSTERRAFMTLAFTIFDLERGTIRHTNAGHLYPYLLRDGATSAISIECPSLPLGVREQMTTRTVEVPLLEGDSIVYLSDGIVEAQDENGDPLGFDQLESLLAAQTDRSPSSLRDTILEAVARHSGTRPADDDRTVMVLRFDRLLTVAEAEAEPLTAAVAG